MKQVGLANADAANGTRRLRWVESRHGGSPAARCAPWPLMDLFAVFSKKVEANLPLTIPEVDVTWAVPPYHLRAAEKQVALALWARNLLTLHPPKHFPTGARLPILP